MVYANKVAFSLFTSCEIKIGEKLPPEFLIYIERVILEKEICILEQKDEKNKCLLIFKFPGEDYVFIYGFDLAFLNEILYREKTGEILPIPVHFSGPFIITLDQTAETIASILKVESCKILKVSRKKAEFQANFFLKILPVKNLKNPSKALLMLFLQNLFSRSRLLMIELL